MKYGIRYALLMMAMVLFMGTGYVSADAQKKSQTKAKASSSVKEGKDKKSSKKGKKIKKGSLKKKNVSRSVFSNDVKMNSVRIAEGGIGEEVAQFAAKHIGNPYVWGGTSLTKGADCSGFTMSVYSHFGYSLPHSAAGQARYGKKVKVNEKSLKAGDLIFYGHGRSIGHVAIYAGDGKVVHASNSRVGIIKSNYRYRRPIKAVRINK